MKWFLIIGGIVLVGAFVFWQRGGTKSSYVNGLPAYSHLPNREYVLERDCYIFKLKDRNTSFPLIGTHEVVADLPAAVERGQIGADLPKVRILDVVPVGSVFRIVSVRRDTNQQGETITFEILLLDNPTREYQRLDAFFLLDHSPEKNGAAPTFLEKYLVDRVRK